MENVWNSLKFDVEKNKTWIDLSFPIEEGMMTYPRYWHPEVKISQLGKIESEGRESRLISFGTHTGTHIDAPQHFVKGDASIDKIPITTCVGPALLISFQETGVQEVTLSHLQKKIGDDVPQKLIIRFGWSKEYGKDHYYKRYPYFTEEACRWLAQKGVHLVGYDTPSPDNPSHTRESSVDSPNHKLLLGQYIYLLEYLSNLDKLKEGWIYLIALPLKIKNGDGSPARVIACSYEK